MSFITKKLNQIILNFPKDVGYPRNTKNVLKNGWPIYELWLNNNFIGFWEFIPDGNIGVNPTIHHRFWCIIYDTIFIFNKNHQPVVFFEKDQDNFIGYDFNNDNNKYYLKYIET